MGKYDVTLGQYAQFLNAVAKTDTYGLYNWLMGATRPFPFGISRSGGPGSFTYAVTGSAAGKDNMPVFDVTWGDAARFCNWLDNGQGTASNVASLCADRNRRLRAKRWNVERRDDRCRFALAQRQRRPHRFFSPRKATGTRRRITRAAAQTPATGLTLPKATTPQTTLFRIPETMRTSMTTAVRAMAVTPTTQTT